MQGISEIITLPGLINVDFADVKTVLQGKGTALMGIGIASGPNRAVEAARMAISSPLLEVDINGATDAIVQITSDADITMKEVEDVISEIRNASSTEIEIIHGTGFNLELNGEVVVTVIATGFDTINKTETENIVKEEEVNRSYQTTHNKKLSLGHHMSKVGQLKTMPKKLRKPKFLVGFKIDLNKLKAPFWVFLI